MQSYNFTPEDMFWGQLAGCLEAIDAGTTYVLDHSHGNYTPEHGESLLPCFFFAPAFSLLSYRTCLFKLLCPRSCLLALPPSFLPPSSHPIAPASFLSPRSCSSLLPPHFSPLVLSSLVLDSFALTSVTLTSSPSFLPFQPYPFAPSPFYLATHTNIPQQLNAYPQPPPQVSAPPTPTPHPPSP